MAEETSKFKNLAEATPVSALAQGNSLFAEVDGSVRRITLADFQSALNSDQEQLLQSVAWGIPLKYGVQSSPAWGVVGNQSAWAAYRAKIGRYACTSKSAGIIQAAKLHPNDSSMLVDGTAVATDGTQTVMVIAPRLYYLVRSGETYPTLWLSEFPISEHYFATTADGKYIVAGAYKGRVIDSKLVSVAGGKFGQSLSLATFWARAQNFNTGMGVINYDFLRWFQSICLQEAAGNANAQASLGYGPGGGSGITWNTFNASDVLTLTGKTEGLGDATGTVEISTDDGGNSNSCHVSVAGIEDFWNSQFEMVQGVYFGASNNEAQDGTEMFIYSGNRIPTSTELSTKPEGSFRQLTRLTSDGYVKEIVCGEWFDTLPSAVGGGSTSYFCDYFYQNSAAGQLFLGGGSSGLGSAAGPFSVDSYRAFGLASSNFGARPAFYGTVEFV